MFEGLVISDFIKGIFTGGFSVTIIFLFLIYLWVKYPNNVKIVLSQIWLALSYIFKRAELKYISNHIEGSLGKSIDKINREVSGLEADKIKIQFIRSKNKEVFIKERALIIRMQRKENQIENLVDASIIYIENILYSKLELHLDDDQKESFKLYTAKSILKKSGGSALQTLHKNHYLPVARDNEKIQSYFEKLEKIDNRGLFYNLFVQEMVFLGNKVYFKRKPQGIEKEVEKFVDFLEQFAEREKGDIESEKTFSKTNIKVALVLIALREKRELGVPDRHVKYIKGLIPQGIESFYLLGWGLNIPFTHRVANAVKEEIKNLIEIHRVIYKSIGTKKEPTDALSVLFRNKTITDLQEYFDINKKEETNELVISET